MRELKKYRVNIPAGVKDGSRIRLAGKGEAGLRGGPSGDLFVITHVGESPVFHAQGRQLRGRGPDHGAPRRSAGPTSRCPTLHGTKKLRVPPGHEARHGPAPARRGPADARAAAARATCTTGS